MFLLYFCSMLCYVFAMLCYVFYSFCYFFDMLCYLLLRFASHRTSSSELGGGFTRASSNARWNASLRPGWSGLGPSVRPGRTNLSVQPPDPIKKSPICISLFFVHLLDLDFRIQISESVSRAQIYVFAMLLLCFAMFLLCFAMFSLCFAMFCYVLLCFAIFCYALLCFCHVLLCFAMFYYVLLCFCYVLLCFCYVLLFRI